MQVSPRAEILKGGRTRAIGAALLRQWPLPKPASDADKEERGSVLIAGGSPEVPGALILSGLASLRAGAGKLQIAAPRGVAASLGTVLMEAGVFPLTTSTDGSLGKKAGRELRKHARSADAVLIGPGTFGDRRSGDFVNAFLGEAPGCPVVIDAGCLGRLPLTHRLGPRFVLTPHAGEMAAMLDIPKEAVAASTEECASEVAHRLDAVVVLKGAKTIIATPSDLFRYDGANPGLATSGSGDVLSGIIAGLLARSIEPLRAAAWGVYIHGAAGGALRRRVGRIGFLARELLQEIPRAMLRPPR